MFGMEKQSLPQHSPYVPSPHHFIFWRKSTKKHFFVEKGFLMVCKKVFPPMFSNVSFISSLGVRAPLLFQHILSSLRRGFREGGGRVFFSLWRKIFAEMVVFFGLGYRWLLKKRDFFWDFPPSLIIQCFDVSPPKKLVVWGAGCFCINFIWGIF